MEKLVELWDRYRMQFGIVAVLLVVGIGYFTSNHHDSSSESNYSKTIAVGSSSSSNSINNSSTVWIDIKGAVKKPGVYQLKATSRVNEALYAAQGPLANADLKQVNLAKQLTDQQMIYIPYQGEQVATATGGESLANNDSAVGSETVNLNTATKEQLCQITGIGDKKADLILQYRQEHGQFKSVDELKEINGFGEKTVAKLKDQLAV